MTSEVLPTFEAFMAEPETAFKLYLEAVKAMASLAEMKTTFEQASAAIKAAENLQTELAAEKERNSRLQFRILQLERSIYGRRSEKLSPAELNQLRLDIHAEEIASSTITGITDVHYKKVRTVTAPKAHPGTTSSLRICAGKRLCCNPSIMKKVMCIWVRK